MSFQFICGLHKKNKLIMQYKQIQIFEDVVGLPPIPALISIILNRHLIRIWNVFEFNNSWNLYLILTFIII